MIKPRGNPSAPVWFVIDKPYEKDAEDGYVISGAMGHVFDKFNRQAGIQDYYVTDKQDEINIYKPLIICPLGPIATATLCPETKKRAKDATKAEASLEKYAGSILISPNFTFPHYCIPLLSPDAIVANWEYKFIHTQIDLGHVREELSYLQRHSSLQPHTQRTIITEPIYSILIDTLRSFQTEKLISMDIETIRPTKGNVYYGQMPGHLYTIAISNSPIFGISFCPWHYEDWQIVSIFRELNQLFKTVPQVGQNYFTFDTHFTEAYGLEHCLEKCEDTMLRHQILWPELPHKLQFLTKQYTRQPYYKDEGKGWNPKQLKRLMIYNALDSCVTFECYLGQEEEFNDRPYLK